MKIVPLGARILIKQVEGKNVTKGGILLPDQAKQKPSEGLVLALGKKPTYGSPKSEAPFAVEIGDHILYRHYGGDEFEIDGNTFTILEEKEILGKLVK